jgi:hypothetical protein
MKTAGHLVAALAVALGVTTAAQDETQCPPVRRGDEELYVIEALTCAIGAIATCEMQPAAPCRGLDELPPVIVDRACSEAPQARACAARRWDPAE